MSEIEEKLFKPEIQSRKNEVIVWCLAILICGSVYLFNSGILFWTVIFFAAFFLLFALGLSLSNWMDRRTYIRLTPDGIHFENGLRKTSMTWAQVQSVTCGMARLGKRVQVSGENEHFTFTVMSDIHIRGKVQGRVGFADGQAIMDEIIRKSGLTNMAVEGETYYYSHP